MSKVVEIDLAALGGDNGRVGAHGNFHVRRAQLKRDVDAAHLAAFEDDIIGHESLEARAGSRQTILASRQVHQLKVAVFIGGDFAAEICALMNHSDLGIDNHRAGLVGGRAS